MVFEDLMHDEELNDRDAQEIAAQGPVRVHVGDQYFDFF